MLVFLLSKKEGLLYLRRHGDLFIIAFDDKCYANDGITSIYDLHILYPLVNII